MKHVKTSRGNSTHAATGVIQNITRLVNTKWGNPRYKITVRTTEYNSLKKITQMFDVTGITENDASFVYGIPSSLACIGQAVTVEWRVLSRNSVISNLTFEA